MTEAPRSMARLLRRVRLRARRAATARGAVQVTFAAAGLSTCVAVANVVLAATDHPARLPWWPPIAFAVAGVIVVIVAVAGRPIRVARVALHVDRTLGLHELFSTALATGGDAGAAARSIRAAAEARAATIDPAAVPIEGPSPRRAAAAGLSLLLAVVLAALATDDARPTASRADATRSTVAPDARIDDDPPAATVRRGVAGSAAREQNQNESAAGGARDVDERRAEVPGATPAGNARVAASGTARGEDDALATRGALAFAPPRGTPAGDASDATATATSDRPGRGPSAAHDPSADTSPRSRDALVASATRLARAHESRVMTNAARVAGAPERCRDLVRAYFDVVVERADPRAEARSPVEEARSPMLASEPSR